MELFLSLMIQLMKEKVSAVYVLVEGVVLCMGEASTTQDVPIIG